MRLNWLNPCCEQNDISLGKQIAKKDYEFYLDKKFFNVCGFGINKTAASFCGLSVKEFWDNQMSGGLKGTIFFRQKCQNWYMSINSVFTTQS